MHIKCISSWMSARSRDSYVSYVGCGHTFQSLVDALKSSGVAQTPCHCWDGKCLWDWDWQIKPRPLVPGLCVVLQ